MVIITFYGFKIVSAVVNADYIFRTHISQPSPPRHPDIMYHLHHRVLQGGDDSVPKNV